MYSGNDHGEFWSTEQHSEAQSLEDFSEHHPDDKYDAEMRYPGHTFNGRSLHREESTHGLQQYLRDSGVDCSETEGFPHTRHRLEASGSAETAHADAQTDVEPYTPHKDALGAHAQALARAILREGAAGQRDGYVGINGRSTSEQVVAAQLRLGIGQVMDQETRDLLASMAGLGLSTAQQSAAEEEQATGSVAAAATAATANPEEATGGKDGTFDPDNIDFLLQGVQRDAGAVAASVKAVFDSIRGFLSESMGATEDHLEEYERLLVMSRDSTDQSVVKARAFVHRCLCLHKSLGELEPLATHVKALRRMVEQLEAQSSKIL